MEKNSRSALEILDADFIRARSQLLDLAAFRDRIDRAGGTSDPRYASFVAALDSLSASSSPRTPIILDLFSDPTEAPIDNAPGKGAIGAWPDFGKQAP
ncbi:MAG TPA: hypothetical protein PKE55_13105 [Kiritimatiellia bacterium]|nr:hypothetical protein [Kiritimatiellia bacterium]